MSDIDGATTADPDEQTALLFNNSKPKVRTPLPKLQLTILLILNLCEPITGLSIYPYINQLIGELDITGGDKRKVGYYAGLIESLFFVTQAFTVLHWSRASDHIGRKPVLLIGLAGSAISMLFFGLSRSFWLLVISRCLCGLLNGNVGVMKSVMGEITDSTNRADGFAMIPVIYALGVTVAPMIGGSLSRPHERFPETFTSRFWRDYPYFLPCVVSASVSFFGFIITLILLKETVPRRSHDENGMSPPDSKPVPLRQLLTYPVLISIANYVSLAFLEINIYALIPLFMAMPTSIGGMELSPAMIGYLFGAFGAFNGIYQTLCFARIARRFGERRVMITAMSMFPIIFLLLLTMSIMLKNRGPQWIVWTLLTCMFLLMAMMDMGFGCVFIYITTSSPNKRSLGATNGLTQTTVSIVRAIGPAMTTSLFSFSVTNNLLGGYGVYVILSILSCAMLPIVTCLPPKPWEEKD
ncbi:hypothetical protein AMATHDRAFT_143443 [Amanita thiersii Skay4041]|uniref:Major facilitator superfamily (MFS) profile domain-containing protein n=1 Tax=Amanita thiersii Skay4041 TaxID=703135 RepID=A0A2A9NKG1_9AGAR|nr:hypothetical protein AMATHDRAFT_143443 [Amanita thiersii Skay4041]